jgi:DNA-binding LacI/PurR family transcriptional regulator
MKTATLKSPSKVTGFSVTAVPHSTSHLRLLLQPIYQIAQQFTQILVGMIRENPPAQSGVLLISELIVRASSGSLRHDA